MGQKTSHEQFKAVQKWLEDDLYQLDQMVQTLQDYYTLTPEDIEHLNRHAKRTLLSMLPALVDSIFIRIARLTEFAKKCGHENLTLGSLVHLLNDLGEEKKQSTFNTSSPTSRIGPVSSATITAINVMPMSTFLSQWKARNCRRFRFDSCAKSPIQLSTSSSRQQAPATVSRQLPKATSSGWPTA